MHKYNDYSIDGYGWMIRDKRRMGAFTEALRRAIQPGSVVLDIGAGTGIFSFLACQFGAARVYAVEPDACIDVARACARSIPATDRITWIRDLSTAIDLPERADVIIADLHGTLPFFKGNLESMSDARKRHLKPGGRMIPGRDILRAVPADAPYEHQRLQDPWQGNDYGFDFSAGLPYVANTMWRARAEPVLPENLLSSPAIWGEVPYATADITGLDNSLAWEIERPGTLHGLYVWFDGDLGEGVGFSNAPQLPELVYGRAFFPLERAVDVIVGDRLMTTLSVRNVQGDYVYRWKSRITSADGSVKASFDQSTFKAELLDPAKLRKGSADYTPALGIEGQVARAVLQGLSESRPLKEIAQSMAVAFPQKFSTTEQALVAVAKLSQQYG